MKAIKIGDAEDVETASTYEGSVDWLMFDAKAPKSLKNALPGGNALAFDWTLMADQEWSVPWMLAGGLIPDNVVAAVGASGAAVVDISSGVESARCRKDPLRITAFLDALKNL